MVLVAGLMFALAPIWPAAAQTVGSVGASNPRSVGTPPRAKTRDLVIGASVVSNEHIQTSGEGTAHITFLDRTTLSLGRNSSVTIDKYVYDTDTGTGQLAASMAKGVMRFVGGQISHTTGAEVTTPVATIGVRGGMFSIMFVRGGIIVVNSYGRVEGWNNVSRVSLWRPGYAIEIKGLNQPIGQPFLAPPGLVEEIFAATKSGFGQHGGAVHPPTDAMLARLGVGEGRLPNDPASSPGLDTIGIINTGAGFVANKSQQEQWNGTTIPHRYCSDCNR